MEIDNEKQPVYQAPEGEGSSSQGNDEVGVDEEDDFASLLQPTRWWMTSTAFPLLAGTFGPMANAFSICSLTQNWRYEVHPGAGMVDVKDDKWVIAVNAVSLTFALISNFSLLLNMARRLPFSIAQPITIVGWYLSSLLLLALVSVISYQIDTPANDGRQLTQAYYYAIIAAAVYFVISSLMVVTVYGAYKGHYSQEFSLTTSQRTLMLQTISFMVYLLGGSAIFAHVENWRYLDALYWADFTLLTIGIGDFAPATSVGRGLLFPYAFGGILVLGLVVGSIRSLMIERGEKKMIARITEKTRKSVIRKVTTSDRKKSDLTLVPSDGNTESEFRRREQEFHLMRRINHVAARKRKWFSLIIPVIAWLMLWFLGALAFWKSESDKGWSYFDSIYFSYTSLLTIGYGDISPSSMWGKPFFVFWSMLAVPTLTILISSMGDTLVKGVRDATIYVGELTVLPGDYGVVTRLRAGLYKVSNGKIPATGRSQPSNTREQEIDQADENAPERDGYEQTKTRELEDALNQSVHHYHHLLVKELRNMQRQVNLDSSRKFDYGEWAYYLKLIGQDESCSNYHRFILASEGDRVEDDGPSRPRGGSLDERLGNWSWIGERSPLIGDKEESEWLLEALSEKLEWELNTLSKRANRAKSHQSI
ncbi:Potassium channel [Arachnomyces sp. PD_36]|nr:Potassium channel [Arachnomyces sp. PD_36]